MGQKSLILILLIAVAIISISCTQRGRDRRDYRPEAYQPDEFHILGTIPDILLLDFNLTSEQVSKITALRDNLIQEIKPLQERTTETITLEATNGTVSCAAWRIRS